MNIILFQKLYLYAPSSISISIRISSEGFVLHVSTDMKMR